MDLAGIGLTIVVLLGSLFTSERNRFIGRLLLGFSIVLLGVEILTRDSLIPINSHETQLTIAFLLSVVSFACGFFPAGRILSLTLIGMSAAFVLLAAFVQSESDALSPPWIWTHITLMILGEVAFMVSASLALMYLVLDRGLRGNHGHSSFWLRLPSLNDLNRYLGEMLGAGFFLLTAGMMLGFIFAQKYWESNWVLDPKVLLCLLTWVVYALILILRRVSLRYHGRTTAILALLGFVSVILLTWGMDLLLPSQHHLGN